MVKVDIPYFNAGAPNDVVTKKAGSKHTNTFNFKTCVEYGIEDTLHQVL
jgi:hypothetical protein